VADHDRRIFAHDALPVAAVLRGGAEVVPTPGLCQRSELQVDAREVDRLSGRGFAVVEADDFLKMRAGLVDLMIVSLSMVEILRCGLV
jgi:hypothetical protein